MVSEKIEITSRMGIHLRPAGAMSDVAAKYKSKITFLYKDSKEANAKSVISILASGVKCGEIIELRAEGEDEAEALPEVVKAFKESLIDD